MKPKIIFLMGVSWSGKSTIRKEILKMDEVVYVPSCSTRVMRPEDGEKNGQPYWFFSKEEFEKMIDNDEFVEWATVHKVAYYGSRYSDLQDVLDQWKYPIKEIEILGLDKIVANGKIDGKYVTIFMDLDNETMRKRILWRQPNISQEELHNRLESADYERKRGHELCDYIIDASPTIPEVVTTVSRLVREKIMGDK